ncbi:hypothetical protein GUITHDRAFT_155061 [Guillardia theta CCMP2712]|uniref:Uncharacterized protein n=1 Tax=Guillardia theta (strain CCMP2712) TaxID=905079 RepID=L1IMA9_GUITC|nr:hypothetical protein GUITHDRAFT_155061 [Guillardia theta CCMP2712]EKX37039.1 hypothetical protein GUITHDRAFT_155061 [Guillardia theta CCMP2712]|mmetsp:Transcript_11701/g.40438  ORF Transcript_11701/g.40438 Transcript_11701/m.40438 type:complete len:215 (+) Transcript_11701:341-985(+)|eukprot:XP_005824019.1 hypothetical protein GUITHDRAFT_155061 [Guillardia theta CCMP2712]
MSNDSVCQWSELSKFESWKKSPERSELFKAAELMVEEDLWEDSEDRSNLFQFAKILVQEDEWEGSQDRSDQFKVAKILAEDEEWTRSSLRSELFLSCYIDISEEEWEHEETRSELFKEVACSHPSALEEGIADGPQLCMASSAMPNGPTLFASPVEPQNAYLEGACMQALEEIIIERGEPACGVMELKLHKHSPNNVAELPFHAPPALSLLPAC